MFYGNVMFLSLHSCITVTVMHLCMVVGVGKGVQSDTGNVDGKAGFTTFIFVV